MSLKKAKKLIGVKRPQRDEGEEEATQLYLEGQNALRSITRNGSLKDALSRSLTQIMSETNMQPSEASRSMIFQRSNSSMQVPPSSNPPVATTGGEGFVGPLDTAGRAAHDSQNSVPGLGTPLTGNGASSGFAAPSILDVTNRFMSSIQQKRTSRIETVMKRSATLHQGPLLEPSPSTHLSAAGGGKPVFPAVEFELHVENAVAIPTAATVEKPKAAPEEGDVLLEVEESAERSSEEDVSSDGEGDEEEIEGLYEDGSERDDEGDEDEKQQKPRRKHLKPKAGQQANPQLGESSTNAVADEDEDSDSEAERAELERIKRSHDMAKLKKAMSAKLAQELASPVESQQQLGGPNRPPAAVAVKPIGGIANGLPFRDAAAKRRELLSKQTANGIFCGVSQEAAQMVQRTSSFENSVTTHVVFDKRREGTGTPANADPSSATTTKADNGPTKPAKPKIRVAMVTKSNQNTQKTS